MGKKPDSTENIKARMYARMARLWDIHNVDSLDPLVKLMVDSLASELSLFSGEINTFQNRVVEKLAREFVPSDMTTASPAHALLHARATSGSAIVDTNTEFVYKDPRFTQKHGLHKLSMTPVCDAPIFDTGVVSFIAPEHFYTVTPQGGKEHVASSIRRDPAFNSAVWVGLEIGGEVDDLRNATFWFDFPQMDDPAEYVRLVGYGKWSHNGTPITTVSGFPENIAGNDDGRVFGEHNPKFYMRDEIAAKYNNRFVHINQRLPVGELKREKIPGELARLFDEGFVKGLREDVVWFKVFLPPAFSDYAIMNTLAIHTNCFPAVNIYSKQIAETIQPQLPIVGLDKDGNEYFLFIQSVGDSLGRRYKEVQTHSDAPEQYTYSIRRGIRSDSGGIRDFIERLLDIYRDESIAFSKFDIDITGMAEGILERLFMLENTSQSDDDHEEPMSFVVLNSDTKEDIGISVNYQMTNGIIANDIKAGETLSVFDTADIASDSAILMTATRGGSKSPSEARYKAIYGYLLASHDRIYTRWNIRTFCLAFYGDYFTDVAVENAYVVSNRPMQGIIRTTNVILRGVTEMSGAERGILANDILVGLERRSPDGSDYRIIFE